MNFDCPKCGADLQASIESQLPDETDLTISLEITPGQLVMSGLSMLPSASCGGWCDG